jgi:hypothetical protein
MYNVHMHYYVQISPKIQETHFNTITSWSVISPHPPGRAENRSLAWEYNVLDGNYKSKLSIGLSLKPRVGNEQIYSTI